MRLKLKAHLVVPIKHAIAKILHITDTHLFADDEGSLLGVKTNASFDAVINEIKQGNQHFDLIVATGDFVQDGSMAAYQRFAQAISQFSSPCVWLAGNHDVYVNMTCVFKQYNLPEHKIILLGDKWLVIMLNSQVPQATYGQLSSDELTFLSSALQRYPERFAMVFLHHHPVMSNCNWLDKHCLINHEEFINLVNQYANIKGIGWGHIHQQTQHQLAHCLAFSTPSTCVQFAPMSYDFKVAEDLPGWRMIDLQPNGTIDSVVHKLVGHSFYPDMSQTGY